MKPHPPVAERSDGTDAPHQHANTLALAEMGQRAAQAEERLCYNTPTAVGVQMVCNPGAKTRVFMYKVFPTLIIGGASAFVGSIYE
jgi:hypothetical protein